MGIRVFELDSGSGAWGPRWARVEEHDGENVVVADGGDSVRVGPGPCGTVAKAWN